MTDDLELEPVEPPLTGDVDDLPPGSDPEDDLIEPEGDD